MKIKQVLTFTAVAAATLAAARLAQAMTLPVTDWVVHNGTSTVTNAATNAPTFTPGDNIAVMAPFPDIALANDGDYVTFSTTLTLNNRTTTGINSLNTQLRVGLFDGPAGPVVASDVPNLGFIIEYTNQAAGGLIREQQNAAQTNPFTSPVNIGNGTQDSGGDSIQGANPGPVTFELTLTRNAGKLDLSGKISGTDSVTTNPYLSTYSVTGYSSANFPDGGTFRFNRAALFLGDNVNAESGDLFDATVTTNVPEPSAIALAAGLALGAAVAARRMRRPLPQRVGERP